MSGITHAELVALGAAWVRRAKQCRIVLCEPGSWRTKEVPDVIGWTVHAQSVLVECKTSRDDFRRDRKKPARQVGLSLGDERYYLAPYGVLQPSEIPRGYGLLEARTAKRLVVTVPAEPRQGDVLQFGGELTLVLYELERALRGAKTRAVPLPAWETPLPKQPNLRWAKGYAIRRSETLIRRDGRELAVVCPDGSWVAKDRLGNVVGSGTSGWAPVAEAEAAAGEELVRLAKEAAVACLMAKKVIKKGPVTP